MKLSPLLVLFLPTVAFRAISSPARVPSTRTLRMSLSSANAFAASCGLLVAAPTTTTTAEEGVQNTFTLAPYTLNPSPVSSAAFTTLTSSLPDLLSKVTHRQCTPSGYKKFLRPNLVTAALGDPDFTGKMMEIADWVEEQGRSQELTLNVLRSDYMLQSEGSSGGVQPLQIELNTIASSFGVLSEKVSGLHAHLAADAADSTVNDATAAGNLPTNNARAIIVDDFADAVSAYGRPGEEGREKVVVMVIQPGEKNSIDQFGLQSDLLQRHGIRLLRRSIDSLGSSSTLAGPSKRLVIPDDKGIPVEVALVYYRAGYTPDDYTPETWDNRKKIEGSHAIKCPDIFSHLAGTKKIQQVLASETDTLREFCDSAEEAKEISGVFAGLWGFTGDDKEDEEVIHMAITNPDGFVFKPQREGGGNNLFGEEMVSALNTMGGEERASYILMERIQPPVFRQTLIKGGEVVFEGDCICELGIFSASLRNYEAEDNGRENLCSDKGNGEGNGKKKGFILRAKMADTDEGGVAAGYAFLSSPVLI